MADLESIGRIESKIFQIRGKKVMLDKDLALLYGVKPIALRQQVKRNRERFPADFMFQLTEGEAKNMVSHFVIPSKQSMGGFLPYVFTEQGVAMLSSVLRSRRAVSVNIHIMRAFVNLRRMALTYAGLKRKIDEMEEKYDTQFKAVFDAFRKLFEPPKKERKIIGFSPAVDP
ncbi:MAG: ORF6N domain-containing protein [Candidatus Omnitrophica bacterium]|nr:ORF6N domain-containing protein [Candidatus Omnitrophota bacterium]